MFDHFKNYPKKTLGVVTFSIAQMTAVEEAIERRLNEQPDFEPFFKEDRLEGFFVKNLENVQGDERDVIFFSVGYGYDQQGQMTMKFLWAPKQARRRATLKCCSHSCPGKSCFNYLDSWH